MIVSIKDKRKGLLAQKQSETCSAHDGETAEGSRTCVLVQVCVCSSAAGSLG